MGKRHGPEEIIGKLREAEIVLAQGENLSRDSNISPNTDRTHWTPPSDGEPNDPAGGPPLRYLLRS